MQSLGDPSETTIWEGRKLSLTGVATSGRLPTNRYRATTANFYWIAGRIGSKTNSAPMWAVRDAVVSQNVVQRARRVGTVTVSLQHRDYRGLPTFILLEDIEQPRIVAKTLTRAAKTSRREHDEAVPEGS